MLSAVVGKLLSQIQPAKLKFPRRIFKLKSNLTTRITKKKVELCKNVHKSSFSLKLADTVNISIQFLCYIVF